MHETGVVEGQILGRYELLLRVAQGGMARVWAARLHGTRGFRKLVAVKTILPGVMDGERLEQMFLEEATLASGIHHPNVVDTLELGEQDGVLFMVLEWVDGEPLSLLMHEAQKMDGIPLPICVSLVGQMCKGLHAAHELADENGKPLGVVHRDISPHNILVTYTGTAKVLDFGIAKATQRSSGLTEAGEVKGKLAYMAPEQVRGRPVDRRTDVFALGTLLYQLTTGHHPWKGDHPGATTQRLVSERPAKPPSALREDYPPALEAAVLRALEKDPERRFPTAASFLAALEDAVPSSLESNAEARIAELMKALVGARGLERRKQIRLAGELLDQRRALTGIVTGIGSSGSTSAMAVDSGSSSHSRLSAVSTPGSLDVTPSLRLERRRLDKFVWVGVAAAFAGCLGFVARRSVDHATTPQKAAALGLDASMASAVSVPAAPVSATASPVPSATALEAGTGPARDALPDAGSKDKTRSGARVGARALGVRVAPPSVPGAPASSATSAPHPEGQPAPAVAATSNAAPQSGGNSWNPKTFGNRY